MNFKKKKILVNAGTYFLPNVVKYTYCFIKMSFLPIINATVYLIILSLRVLSGFK